MVWIVLIIAKQPLWLEVNVKTVCIPLELNFKGLKMNSFFLFVQILIQPLYYTSCKYLDIELNIPMSTFMFRMETVHEQFCILTCCTVACLVNTRVRCTIESTVPLPADFKELLCKTLRKSMGTFVYWTLYNEFWQSFTLWPQCQLSKWNWVPVFI